MERYVPTDSTMGIPQPWRSRLRPKLIPDSPGNSVSKQLLYAKCVEHTHAKILHSLSRAVVEDQIVAGTHACLSGSLRITRTQIKLLRKLSAAALPNKCQDSRLLQWNCSKSALCLRNSTNLRDRVGDRKCPIARNHELSATQQSSGIENFCWLGSNRNNVTVIKPRLRAWKRTRAS